jgi:asparagine synthase (glutamine-hydrolysing)
MCGIFGVLAQRPGLLDQAAVATALRLLRHRGPDDEGVLLHASASHRTIACAGPDTPPELQLPRFDSNPLPEADCALGHRRLSIIDLSVGGHQPMSDPAGRWWITYNGEIYNYRELRRELEAAGQVFRTTSDTEVLLRAWLVWGEGMLPRLVGMFAFALLDTATGELVLARDPFGIKPLYYTWTGGAFAFASEIKALLSLPGFERRANLPELLQYLRYGERSAGGETLFAGIESLPAAHLMRLANGQTRSVQPRRYWRLDTGQHSALDFGAAVERVRSVFETSVALHMRSDVPVGSCLSGGLDSTAIVMTAQRDLGPGNRLHAVSFIADDAAISEERYVDQVPGVVVHKVIPRAAEIVDDLPRLLDCQELPFGSTSIYAQFRVFQLAASLGLKVMLDGQGGDEIFAGYYFLIGARLTSLLASGRLGAARRVLAAAPRNARPVLMRMLATALGRLAPAPLQALGARVLGEPPFPRWLAANWFRGRGLAPVTRAHGRGRDALHQELQLGIEHLTLPHLLRYEDSSSMYFSIESRVPFCVRELAELALSLPEQYLIADSGSTKHVFREAMRGLVPDAIIRREKVGFLPPERRWLNELRPWLAQVLGGEALASAPFLAPAAVRASVEAALRSEGRWPAHVWRIVNLLEWAKHYQVGWS